MAGINTLYMIALLYWATAWAGDPGKLEVLIEVDGSSGALNSVDQQKAIFSQLKEKIESSLQKHGSELREIPGEDERGDNKRPSNDEMKRIEVAPGGGLKQAPRETGSERMAKVSSLLLNAVQQLKKSPLLKLSAHKSFMTEPGAPIVDNLGRKVEILEYTDDMLRIGTDRNLFLTITNNLETMGLMKDKTSADPIEGIAIYKDPENGKLVDFWHKLAFEEKDGSYKDRTGFFKGVLKSDWDDLAKSSRLGKFGFFIDSGVSGETEELMVYRSKKLIIDIAYFRKLKVGELMARNKPLDMLESIVFYHLYPLRPNDIIDVCVCANNNCKKPCTEIQRIERKSFL